MSVRTNRSDELSFTRAERWGRLENGLVPEALVCKGLEDDEEELLKIGSGLAVGLLTKSVC